MANIKRRTKDGSLLIAYRPRPGEAQVFAVVAEGEFEEFKLVEKQYRLRGEETPHPSVLFAAAPAEASTSGSVTLSEWVGTVAEPGPHFLHSSDVGVNRIAAYEQTIRKWASPFLVDTRQRELPMRDVRRRHVVTMVNSWLICEACRARAVAAEIDPAGLDLRVTSAPWDGDDEHGVSLCVDDEGESAHYPTRMRSSMRSTLAMLHAAFTTATTCDEPVADTNPLASYKLPKFADRPTDDLQALSHLQVRDLAAAHPPRLAALVPTATYGLLRRSEAFGLNRGDIRWPGENDEGVGRLDIARVFVSIQGKACLRPWGKTPQATHAVYLTPAATSQLRDHLDRFRSSPSDGCAACAAGDGAAAPSASPHRGCDFADDAPVFVDDAGRRMDPVVYTTSVFPEACKLAGLSAEDLGFVVTPKTLRATGTTLLIEIGVPDDVIMRIGRWTQLETHKRSYHLLRDETRRRAARQLGLAAATELGDSIDERDPAGVRLAAAEVQARAATAEIERLRKLCIGAGIDPKRPAVTPLAFTFPKARPCVWDDHERVRDAVAGATSRREVLDRLGISTAGKHYRLLGETAAAIGITLPRKSARPSVWDDHERVRVAAGAASQTEAAGDIPRGCHGGGSARETNTH